MVSWVRDPTGRLSRVEYSIPDTVIGSTSIFTEMGDELATRALKDYLYPNRASQPSCILLPPHNANNFEFKSGIIHLLPIFRGTEKEDPYLHVCEFKEISGTVRLRGHF